MVAKTDDEKPNYNFRKNNKKRQNTSDEDSDSGNDFWSIIYSNSTLFIILTDNFKYQMNREDSYLKLK